MAHYGYSGSRDGSSGRSGRQGHGYSDDYQRAQQSRPEKFYIHVGLDVRGIEERDEIQAAYSALSYDENVTICTSSRAVARGIGVLIETYIADQASTRNVKNFAL